MSSSARGPRLDIRFERTSLVQQNGDADEFVSLTVHNCGDRACEALSSYGFRFSFTDAPTRLIASNSSFENSTVEPAQEEGRYVVRVNTSTTLAPGQTATIGLHAHAIGRAHFEDGALRFNDSVPQDGYDGLDVRNQTCTVTIIFPRTIAGWMVSGVDAAECTSRAARWEFVHGVHKPIRAKAIPCDDESTDDRLLVFDDILAELLIFIGKLCSGGSPPLAPLLEGIRGLNAPSILGGVEAILADVSVHTGEAQLADLRKLAAELQDRRIPFARTLNGRTPGLPFRTAPNYSSSMIPTAPQIRARIDEVFQVDADFEAFCSDYFPDVYKRFPGEADRVRRVTLLLRLKGPESVQRALDEYQQEKQRRGVATTAPVAPGSLGSVASLTEAPPKEVVNASDVAPPTLSTPEREVSTPAPPPIPPRSPEVSAGAVAPSGGSTSTPSGSPPQGQPIVPAADAPSSTNRYGSVVLVVGLLVLGGIAYLALKTPPVTVANPAATASCAAPREQQRIPYRNGTICVSNAFANLLACLEASKLEDIADDAKSTIEGSGSVGKGQAEAAIKAEKTAVGQLKIKYAAGLSRDALDACIRKFETNNGGPGTSTASATVAPPPSHDAGHRGSP